MSERTSLAHRAGSSTHAGLGGLVLVVVVISLTQYFTVPASSCIVLKSPFFFLLLASLRPMSLTTCFQNIHRSLLEYSWLFTTLTLHSTLGSALSLGLEDVLSHWPQLSLQTRSRQSCQRVWGPNCHLSEALVELHAFLEPLPKKLSCPKCQAQKQCLLISSECAPLNVFFDPFQEQWHISKLSSRLRSWSPAF